MIIQQMIDYNNDIGVRALIALYELQTDEERVMGDSIEHNGQGFDREYGKQASALAQRALAGSHFNRRETEKIKSIVQRFRDQLITKISRDKLQWVLRGTHDLPPSDGAVAETAAATVHSPPGAAPTSSHEDDADDDEYDEEDDEEDDDDDFIDDEEIEEEDEEEDEPEVADFAAPAPARAAPADAAPAPSGAAPADGAPAPAAVAAPAARPVNPNPSDSEISYSYCSDADGEINSSLHRVLQCHADRDCGYLRVTEFGVRGAMAFSKQTETIFQRYFPKCGSKFTAFCHKFSGIPGFRVEDLFFRIWQEKRVSPEEQYPATCFKVNDQVCLYYDGCVVHGRVVSSTQHLVKVGWPLNDSGSRFNQRWVNPSTVLIYRT
jgi:hypothetical protein